MARVVRVGCAVLAGVWFLAAEAGENPCVREVDGTRRLACYDRMFAPPVVAPVATADERQAEYSLLSKRWELLPDDKKGTFQFQYHAPIYLLPVHYSDSVNRNAHSPTLGSVSSAIAPFGATELDWKSVEAKFQLSFKVKALENIVGGNGDLWFGYTQQSYWQVYNKDMSAPFRETNYAPELVNTWRTDVDVLGMKMRLLNLGLIHQSNGKSGAVSRSWNRLYAQAGFERGGLAVLVRPWYRLKEDAEKDDNPDIENYVGRGDLTVAYKFGGHEISAVARHSLRGGADNHGSAELSWAVPISGSLRGYVQAFTGYGESLIDYNHRQTTIGLGISLADWL